jgi:hypothetical protein
VVDELRIRARDSNNLWLLSVSHRVRRRLARLATIYYIKTSLKHRGFNEYRKWTASTRTSLTRPPSLYVQMSSSKHWTWSYFTTDGKFFRDNHSHKNAWCTACLDHHRGLLLQADVHNAASDDMDGPSNRTDAERDVEGE